MILDVVKSKDGVPIRLTFERWEHIIERHPSMSGFLDAVLDAVEYPEFLSRGERGAKTAIVNLGRRRWLHVSYREVSRKDGFIITAFIYDRYDKNKIIWSKHS